MKTRENKEVEYLLQAKGIYAEGGGIIPLAVMRDKRISVEAKAIYGYISTFAEEGLAIVPSVDIMTKELSLSQARFYKYRQMLIDLNYIEITRDHSGNLAYRLVQKPVPLIKQ